MTAANHLGGVHERLVDASVRISFGLSKFCA
jgi:hypothetical protein